MSFLNIMFLGNYCKEMEEAGFIVEQEFDFLPNQYFIIFRLKQIE